MPVPPLLPLLTDFNAEQKLLMTSTCFSKMYQNETREICHVHVVHWRSNTYRFTHAGLRVHIQDACTRVHLHEEPDKTSSGRWIFLITTEEHRFAVFLLLCACAANHYIWRLLCLHSSVMVNGRASPSFVCESALGKQILSHSNMTFSFHLVFVLWLGQRIIEWNLSGALFACDRMWGVIKDRLLLSV